MKDTKGNCPGDSFICPCSNEEKKETGCWEKCVVFDTCKLKEKAGECPGIWCIEFVSPCQTCTEAVRDCTKCELFDNPDLRPSRVREKLGEVLKPTNDLAKPGKHGTFQVLKDGSLSGDGGVEITTVGRRVSYESFYKQAKHILSEAVKRGAYLNERTSIHMHLVAGYFAIEGDGKGGIQIKYRKGGYSSRHFIEELEKPVPELILINFHQLIRRYHNALTWVSSAGESEEHLTRWMKFRMPVIKYSPMRKTMRHVLEELAGADGHSGKYSFINYSNCRWDTHNNLLRLHMEGRYCDGMLSPSAVASLGILMYALLLKAVSLSQYGILHAGDKEYMQQAYLIQQTLLNNSGNWQGPRHSTTVNFEPYREIVRNQAEEMVNLVHYELRGHGDALRILRQLADIPCSMRRIRGDSWDKIEADLSGIEEKETTAATKVLTAIDTFYVDDCENMEEWIHTIAADLEVDINDVTDSINTLLSSRRIMWDSFVGTFLRC